MKFSALNERSSDPFPNIMVTFPDGYTDRLVLRKHYFNDEGRMDSSNDCNYIGYLANEKHACVAMTGCLGLDDIEFTIMSTHSVGSTGYIWTKAGEIHTIDINQDVRKK